MSSSKTINARIADEALRKDWQQKYGVDDVLVSPDVVALIDLEKETVQLLCLLDLAAMGESEGHNRITTDLRLLHGEKELAVPLKNLNINIPAACVSLRIPDAVGREKVD